MTIQVGDLVRWTKISGRRKIVSLQSREGQVIAIEGDEVSVKPAGRGKIVRIHAAGLTKLNEPSTLTMLVTAIVEASRGQ